ncbi:MAG: type IV pilus twitching motility protein PilT [Candidatus Brocadiia bacterium]
MPITEDMARVFRLARKTEASDIHIVAGLPPTFRINGEIILASAPPLSREDTKRLVYGLLNEEQIKTFERDWQLCCSVFSDDYGRMRVSVYYHGGNPELAIRMCNKEIKSRAQLALPEAVDRFTRFPSGLVLVTGPTGSGKTTTLNYMIDLINSERRCKIITIEDPIEYVHERKKAIIIQQELYTDVKSFSSALIHVLRQNPDVICVGEMRDYETTATALTAAETGHLVIATLHTPNSLQTMERIMSVFPATQQGQVISQLANCLHGIVAQRLVPSADKTRRLLACEVLIINTAARTHIRDHEFHQLVNVMQFGVREGMQSMDSCLMTLYEQGEITYDTALTYCTDPKMFAQRHQTQKDSAEGRMPMDE